VSRKIDFYAVCARIHESECDGADADCHCEGSLVAGLAVYVELNIETYQAHREEQDVFWKGRVQPGAETENSDGKRDPHCVQNN